MTDWHNLPLMVAQLTPWSFQFFFFLTANCKLYRSAEKPRITHNVPELIYFNLTKSQTCKGNGAHRGRFEAKNGTTYPHLPYRWMVGMCWMRWVVSELKLTVSSKSTEWHTLPCNQWQIKLSQSNQMAWIFGDRDCFMLIILAVNQIRCKTWFILG